MTNKDFKVYVIWKILLDSFIFKSDYISTVIKKNLEVKNESLDLKAYKLIKKKVGSLKFKYINYTIMIKSNAL